jgi:multimeric flavodoxin WrbA
MAKIVIVYHSGYGHTAKQAEAVAEGAKGVAGAEVSLVPVDKVNWDELKAADAIIFGAPTYMGSLSAPFKAFMDASSKQWMAGDWKDKVAGGFTNSASQSGDKLNSLFQLVVFATQHGMIWVGLGLPPGNNHSKGSVEDLNRLGIFLGAAAQSNADQGPDVVPPETDLRTARHYGARIATYTRQLVRARETVAA